MERPCVPFKIELMGPTKNYNLNWINTFFFSNKRGQHENCSNSIVYYNLHLSYMKAHVYMQCIAFGRAALVRFMFFCFYFFIFFFVILACWCCVARTGHPNGTLVNGTKSNFGVLYVIAVYRIFCLLFGATVQNTNARTWVLAYAKGSRTLNIHLPT